MSLNTLAILGGSFDPVHNAHIAVVDHVNNALKPDEFRVMPCHRPPHKSGLHASNAQRLAMLELAFHAEEAVDVVIDTREFDHPEFSYTFTSLTQLREEVGNALSICFVIGWDSWLGFTTWFRWRELLELANFIVLKRPGSFPEAGSESRQALLKEREVPISELQQYSSGKIAMLNNDLWNCASFDIRQAIVNKKSIESFVPVAVARYIEEQGLYR